MLLAVPPPRVVEALSDPGRPLGPPFSRPPGRARARSQGEDRPSGPTSFASPESRLCSERSHFPVYQRGDDDGSDDELGARDPGHSGTGPVPPPPRGRRDGQRGRDAARDRAHPRAAPLLALAGSGPGGRPYAERRRARTPASSLGRTTPLGVTNALTNFAGVTSNAGFRAWLFRGAILRPVISRTSSSDRSSTGIAVPSRRRASNVLHGAAT